MPWLVDSGTVAIGCAVKLAFTVASAIAKPEHVKPIVAGHAMASISGQ
jgi:hypothetical protein